MIVVIQKELQEKYVVTNQGFNDTLGIFKISYLRATILIRNHRKNTTLRIMHFSTNLKSWEKEREELLR
ncbi:MAG: hypothetical protein WBZ36_29035 [Candidatus Nitrosopolaris sp.]